MPIKSDSSFSFSSFVKKRRFSAHNRPHGSSPALLLDWGDIKNALSALSIRGNESWPAVLSAKTHILDY